MQEEKEHWKMILKNHVAIFVYANEEMWLLGTALPSSYVQAHLYVSIYVKFCSNAIRTFGARDLKLLLPKVQKFGSPYLVMQMRKIGDLKVLGPPPMFKNCYS